MTLEEIYSKVSEETGYPKEDVRKVYYGYWKFIRDTMESLPLDDDLTEDEFSKLKVNFSISHIGKLYCNWKRYRGVKRHFEYNRYFRKVKKRKRLYENKKAKAIVHKDSCDDE